MASPFSGAPALKYGDLNIVTPSPGEVKGLNNNKFKLIENDNKYKLRIELIILTQKRYIDIDLYDNINNNNDEYINGIK